MYISTGQVVGISIGIIVLIVGIGIAVYFITKSVANKASADAIAKVQAAAAAAAIIAANALLIAQSVECPINPAPIYIQIDNPLTAPVIITTQIENPITAPMGITIVSSIVDPVTASPAKLN